MAGGRGGGRGAGKGVEALWSGYWSGGGRVRQGESETGVEGRRTKGPWSHD